MADQDVVRGGADRPAPARGRRRLRIHAGAGAVTRQTRCTPYARRVEIAWAPFIASTCRDIRALEAANRQLLFEVVITEDHDQFGFADTELPKGATARLDALVERLHAYPGGVHLEIEGHTDDTGPTAFNEKLGLERAESVRRYLHERHRLPLHKINVISYGEAKPVESNATKDGRARNRRAVVRVLGPTPQSP